MKHHTNRIRQFLKDIFSPRVYVHYHGMNKKFNVEQQQKMWEHTNKAFDEMNKAFNEMSKMFDE